MSVEYNGLITSEEILNKQREILATPTSVDISSGIKSAPAVIPDSEKHLYSLQTETEKEQQNQTMKEKELRYYDGPTPTGESIKSVAQKYHLPTSVSQTMADAEDAILGITKDLTNNSKDEKKSFMDIITEKNRLRGIGIILICVASMVSILILLAKT